MRHSSVQPNRFLLTATRFFGASLFIAIGCAQPIKVPHSTIETKAIEPVIQQADSQPVQTTEQDLTHPFPRRVPFSSFEFPRDATWLNTGDGAIQMQALKGKFVLFDFWTYCCINCIHVLPELKKLERAYPEELVVIGVHSAKFDAEKDPQNISEAILRYEIEHPVINDPEMKIWRTVGARAWPTLLLIDPEGDAIWFHSGETTFEHLDRVMKKGLPYYERKGVLDRSPVHFVLQAHRQAPTPLRFPGKIYAAPQQDRLYIADSNHNRIVVTSRTGQLIDVIGSGQTGRQDGDYESAQFHHPQGIVRHQETLYVADTENHLIRKVDLRSKRVTTVAGTGQQSRTAFPPADRLDPSDPLEKRWHALPKATDLNSPWALAIHQDKLYIAMAGSHQIWIMPLDETRIGPYAGNGREDIVDGNLLPSNPRDLGTSSFAQPSGLASDGTWLYIADCEGSSIRGVPLDGTSDRVKTIVGTAHLLQARLFTYGDADGPAEQAQLQHPLGVTYHDGQLFVADTYNNKIKRLDCRTGETRTLTVQTNDDGDQNTALFDEPAGLSYVDGKLYVADTNNHRIRVIDVAAGTVETLKIPDLTPPPSTSPTAPVLPKEIHRTQVQAQTIQPVLEAISIKIHLELPSGWEINSMAPMGFYLDTEEDESVIAPQWLRRTSPIPVEKLDGDFGLSIPITGEGSTTLKLTLVYYICQKASGGLCKVGAAEWTIPMSISSKHHDASIQLNHRAMQEVTGTRCSGPRK